MAETVTEIGKHVALMLSQWATKTNNSKTIRARKLRF